MEWTSLWTIILNKPGFTKLVLYFRLLVFFENSSWLERQRLYNVFLEQLTQIFGRNFLSLTKILLWTWSDYLKVNSPLKNSAFGSSSPGDWPRCFYCWLLECSLIAMQVVKVSIVVIVVVLVFLAILVLTMVRALILPVKILPESLVPLLCNFSNQVLEDLESKTSH